MKLKLLTFKNKNTNRQQAVKGIYSLRCATPFTAVRWADGKSVANCQGRLDGALKCFWRASSKFFVF
ncbi:MAG: hypothetical protein K8R67_19425, partial [Desulfobacteraceae bacterium]|nr:hypothetical protein [Desulfobacteraceae bacterium]